MEITEKDVEHIALLAQLKISEEAKKSFTGQLRNILAYMEKLNELDTSEVEPTSHVIPLKNVFKDDLSKEVFISDHSHQNAPQFDKGHYQVPKIIE